MLLFSGGRPPGAAGGTSRHSRSEIILIYKIALGVRVRLILHRKAAEPMIGSSLVCKGAGHGVGWGGDK